MRMAKSNPEVRCDTMRCITPAGVAGVRGDRPGPEGPDVDGYSVSGANAVSV